MEMRRSHWETAAIGLGRFRFSLTTPNKQQKILQLLNLTKWEPVQAVKDCAGREEE